MSQDNICYTKIQCYNKIPDVYNIILLGNNIPLVPFPPSSEKQYNITTEKLTINYMPLDFNDIDIFKGGEIIITYDGKPTPVSSRHALKLIDNTNYFLYTYKLDNFTPEYDSNTLKYFIDEQLLFGNLIKTFIINNITNIRNCGCTINTIINNQIN